MVFETPRQIVRWAGLLYLLLIPLGFFGAAYVPSVIVQADDIVVTVSNLRAFEGLQRLGLVAVLTMNVIRIALVLVLFELFKSAGRVMAGFMVAFLLIGAGISMLNEASLFAALAVSGPDVAAPFTNAQTYRHTWLALQMHEFGTYVAVIFWGLWLFPLGVLAYRSGVMPKILGVLLIVAGFGYVADSFTYFLAPERLVPLADFLFVGEVTFTLWLVFMGVKSEDPDASARSSG